MSLLEPVDKLWILLSVHADLDNAMVWVYFHSNVKEYNRVECWGPLVEAAKVIGFTNLHHLYFWCFDVVG